MNSHRRSDIAQSVRLPLVYRADWKTNTATRLLTSTCSGKTLKPSRKQVRKGKRKLNHHKRHKMLEIGVYPEFWPRTTTTRFRKRRKTTARWKLLIGEQKKFGFKKPWVRSSLRHSKPGIWFAIYKEKTFLSKQLPCEWVRTWKMPKDTQKEYGFRLSDYQWKYCIALVVRKKVKKKLVRM